MMIYFASSGGEGDSVYRAVKDVAHELGHEVAGFSSKSSAPADYRAAIATIEKADLVIAEVSGRSSFAVGFQVAMAAQAKKPTLLLGRKGATTFAASLRMPDVVHAGYDTKNVALLVGDFIKQNTIPHKDLRFNFVIDRQIYNHLRSVAFTTGKTKAEVVRDLLLRDIKKSS